jgi:hypothetical protein
MKLRRPAIATSVVALATAAALAAPGLASASTYCVGNPGGTCDVSKPASASGLEQALYDAQSSAGVPDVVRIGPGTYTGSFAYYSTNEVDIQGSGASTVIQGVGTQAALDVSAGGSGSVISDLEIRMASVPKPENAIGLILGSAVGDNVRVQNPGGSWGAGVELEQDGKLINSTVLAGAGTGVQELGGTGQRTVRDSFIAGIYGVLAPTGTWTLERLHIAAKYMGVQSGATTSLRNSLVRVQGEAGYPSSTYGLYLFGTGALAADHVTIQGGPNVTYGAVVSPNSGTATLTMTNSIVSGPFAATSFAREASASATANITIGHSNFPAPVPSWVDASAGPGVFQQTPAGTNMDADPKFVDPSVTLASPTVDFRLRHDSPLIDKGEPGGFQATDLAGGLRLVGVRDMGAYEYQRRAPTAVIAEPSAGAVAAGASVGFSAAGSGDPDPGDSLEYTWSFGDGATATGPAPSHAYEAAGQRTVTLTVTDPTGLTATATRELQVEGPMPGTGPGPGPGPGTEAADEIAPVLSSVSLSARAFRRRTRVRFSLSEAAAVRFAVRRRSDGRRLGSFVRPAAAGRNSVRFAGRLHLRGRPVSLAPGRYRLTLVARDPSGNRSAARRLPFRVMP